MAQASPCAAGWSVVSCPPRRQARILMLTARDGVEDRVTGLDSGADDYLVKPFASPSCRRSAALLRRDDGTDPVLEVGPLRLDPARFEATRRRGARSHSQGILAPPLLHVPPRPCAQPGASPRARLGRDGRPDDQRGEGHSEQSEEETR